MTTKNEYGLLEAITCGGDERIYPNSAHGTNRYFLNVLEYQHLFQRGSCTCGTLTEAGASFLKTFLPRQQQQSYPALVAEHRQTLKQLIHTDTEVDFDICFGPSGSDMMYLPLLFRSILNPGDEMINIVSCPEELGSGSILAAQGKYHANHSQFGDHLQKHQLINHTVCPRVITLDARSKDGGIVEKKPLIQKILSEHPHSPIVCNLVFGSKSGIKDDLQVIDPDNEQVMWVVDMCQFRADSDLVIELLKKNVMLMLTGSKFYQAPPFCGALLVPAYWIEKIGRSGAKSIGDFDRLFSRYDFPERLKSIGDLFPAKENYGLHVRWAVALNEMTLYKELGKQQTNTLISDWNHRIKSRLNDSPYFRLMPDTEKTNESIISFNVIDANGHQLSHHELKAFYQCLVTSKHDEIPGYERIFLGQPVRYGENSFLRLALGSHGVRELIRSPDPGFSRDMQLIAILEKYIQHFVDE